MDPNEPPNQQLVSSSNDAGSLTGTDRNEPKKELVSSPQEGDDIPMMKAENNEPFIENLPLSEVVIQLGEEMRNTFINWSVAFEKSEQLEEVARNKLEKLEKDALMYEARILTKRLASVQQKLHNS